MAHCNNARPVSRHHPMNTSVRRRHRHRTIRGETGLRPVLLRQTATSMRQRSSMKKVSNERAGVEGFGMPDIEKRDGEAFVQLLWRNGFRLCLRRGRSRRASRAERNECEIVLCRLSWVDHSSLPLKQPSSPNRCPVSSTGGVANLCE